MDQELKLIFIRNIIIDALTLPIPALLIVQALHRKNRTPEIVLFFRMCIFDFLLCISYILACVLLLNYEKILVGEHARSKGLEVESSYETVRI